jgi:small conductance mechanosensitive channel
MAERIETLDQVRASAIDLGMRFGPKLFVALVILVAGIVVSRWAGTATARLLRRFELEPPVLQLVTSAAQLTVLVLFAIMALQNLGVELLPLIAGLGVAGAGVALAMQGVLSNMAAGFTIIFTRPFRVGEYISIVGVEGRVEEVGLFNTTLSHPDLSRVVVPNRKIAGEILHNYGNIRQVEVSVGVAYDTDIDQALALISQVLQSNPRVLRDKAPVVQTSQLDDWSVKIAIRPWVTVADYGAAGGEINKAILEGFRSRGIVMPVPQRDVRLVGESHQP